MSTEDRLRNAVDAVTGQPDSEVTDTFERLMSEYERRVQDPSLRLTMEDAFADAQLGPAAYALGVHYLVQDRLDQADYWLRIAASNDVGDSALRLAQLCELRAVRTFNQSELNVGLVDLSYEQTVEARYWRGRALIAGYPAEQTGGFAKAELPTYPVDCCDHLSAERSLVEAERLLDEAHREADEIVRTARLDARRFVRDARQEIQDLALQRKSLEAQIGQLGDVLHGLSGLLSQEARRYTSKSSFHWLKSTWLGKCIRSAPGAAAEYSALGEDIEYCAEILKSVEFDTGGGMDMSLRTVVSRAVSALQEQHRVTQSSGSNTSDLELSMYSPGLRTGLPGQ
jgi:hypothetical protein